MNLQLNPEFLPDFNPADYPYLGDNFRLPPVSSQWYETHDGHILPVSVFGDRKNSEKAVMLHHGGPGDAIKPSHIAPFLDIDGLVVVVYNQRQSGTVPNLSEYKHEAVEDPIQTCTPDNTIRDIEDIRRDVLESIIISSAGGSDGARVSLSHGITHPEAVDSILAWSVSLGRQREVLATYTPDGEMARSVPQEYERFIGAIRDEKARRDPEAIIAYYNRMMNPTVDGYDEEHARELAVALGLFHLSAADPITYGGKGLHLLGTDQLYAIANSTGTRALTYGRVTMKFFVEDVPRLSSGNGLIIDNIGALRGKRMRVVSGDADPLTMPYVSEELVTAAVAAGVDATRDVVKGGYHDRAHLPMQLAIRNAALDLFA